MAAVPIVALFGARGNDLGTVVVLAAIGFLAPATILSAAAPMIVRATLTDIATSGTIVGRLSAVGTAGALVGTFLTGFVLLGAIPTRSLILGVGALVAVVGLLVSARLSRSRGTLALGGLAIVATAVLAATMPNPCQRESRYYCIAVIPDPDPGIPSGRILVLDNLWHAFVDLDDPTRLQFGYIRWFAAAAAPIVDARHDAFRALHVGGGGFSFPRYLRAQSPASRQMVLELDPAILDVGRTELGFVPDDQIRVELGDARISMARQPTDGFDLVVGDAFGGLSVPWHLTTREFHADVDRVLQPDGTYVLNLIDGPALRFARAEAATLRQTFEHVAVMGLPVVLGPGGFGGNIVLVASHRPIDAAGLLARSERMGEETAVLGDPVALDEFTRGAPILVDDYAPVDQLIGE